MNITAAQRSAIYSFVAASTAGLTLEAVGALAEKIIADPVRCTAILALI